MYQRKFESQLLANIKCFIPTSGNLQHGRRDPKPRSRGHRQSSSRTRARGAIPEPVPQTGDAAHPWTAPHPAVAELQVG